MQERTSVEELEKLDKAALIDQIGTLYDYIESQKVEGMFIFP